MNPAAILLVEDSAADAALIRAAVIPVVPAEQLMICASRVDAIDYLQCRGPHAGRNPTESPKLAIIDLGLPSQSGFDILRAIRATEITRLLPVIVLSPNGDAEEVRTALQLGANSCVRKPPDAAELAQRMALLARYWIDLNIPPPPLAKAS